MKKPTLWSPILLLGLTFAASEATGGFKRLPITSVVPDFEAERLSIYGRNFGNSPVVLLEEDELEVVAADNSFI